MSETPLNSCEFASRCPTTIKLFPLRREGIPNLSESQLKEKAALEQTYHTFCTTEKYISCSTRGRFMGQ